MDQLFLSFHPLDQAAAQAVSTGARQEIAKGHEVAAWPWVLLVFFFEELTC